MILLSAVTAALLSGAPANEVGIGLDAFGLSLSYSHRIRDRWSVGAGVEAGLLPRVLATPEARDSMAEVLRGDAFVRYRVTNPLVLEAGLTAAVGGFGIGTSEASDSFDAAGVYVSPQLGGRHWRIGTRVSLGRMKSAAFGPGDGSEPARMGLYWSPLFLRLAISF